MKKRDTVRSRHSNKTDSKHSVRRIAVRLLFLLLIAAFVGCGGKVAVSGKITFSDDDSPLTRGMVVFESAHYCARGTLDSNGHYVLGAELPGNGIPPGKYHVYITGANKDTPKETGTPESLIDLKYADPSTSGLNAEIDGSRKQFDFRLDRLRSGK